MELFKSNFMQIRDLTDEEWMKLPKKEVIQLYKNCYTMLKQCIKQEPITDADIEAWAKVETEHLNKKNERVKGFCEGLRKGAKAVLNNEIKHIEK
jgi:hypothetical protein